MASLGFALPAVLIVVGFLLGPSAAWPQAGSFEVLADTDLAGGDIALPWTDPTLRAITFDRCRDRCAAKPACRAFTYNAKARVCFLKGDGYAAKRFAGAVSGRRVATSTAPALTRAAHDPFWPATRQGAACQAQVARELPLLAAATGADVAGTHTVPAGQPFPVRWTRREMRGRYPAYLMIAFDGPVRFEGKGFYVLLPNAVAPFGISTFSDRTRAVIPLYGLGVPRNGEFKVRPLQAGPLQMQWAVVGHDFCREVTAGGRAGAATIRAEAIGEPEIVVASFAPGTPRQRILSPAGSRVIEVHDGRYRLIDTASASELADRAGRTPRFSPTGRYLAAYVEDGMEILDTIDGKTVYKDLIGNLLAWDNEDSFAVVQIGGWGALAVIAPSFGGSIVDYSRLDGTESSLLFTGQGSCRVCIATEDTAVRIDLENNVAVMNGKQGAAAASLTSGAKIDGGTRDVIAFVRRQSQTTAFALPTRWELHGGLKFSHLGEADQQDTVAEAGNDPLRKFLVAPRMQQTDAQSRGDTTAVVASQWRGVSAGSAAGAASSMLKRLEEFGIPVAAQPSALQFERKEFSPGGDFEGDYDRDAITPIIREIEEEAPAARGALVVKDDPSSGYLGKCAPEAGGKIYDAFQKAFRFQRGDRVVWMIHYQCADGSAAFKYPTLALFDSASPRPWLVSENTGDPNSNIGTVCFSNVANCELDAQIIGGHYLLLASAQGRAIEVLDLDTRRSLFKKYNLPRGDLLERVLLVPDSRLVLQINSDGSFAGFRLADARLLFEGRYVDDEVVVWTPDGRFDATSEGAHYVSLRLPGRIENHTFEQFSARLRTPGLIEKALAGEQAPPVRLVAPPSLSGRVEARGGRIRGSANAAGDTPLDALLIYQDGLLTDRLGPPADGRSWRLDVALLPGTRWVSMIALDRLGLASVPMGRDVARTAARRVHVLAVGVDNYDDPRITDLQLARSDARRFAQAAAATGGALEVASSRMLLDAEATSDTILSALREAIGRAAPGETVMLLFAGHGVRSADGRFFLATPDTRYDDIPSTALPWTEVAAVLATSKARIAVLLDTCHSGEAGTGAYSTNDAAAKSLLERVPSGIVVFSASKGRELSEETPAAGGGVFTAALVEVVAGDRARYDANRNGAIEISELYRGIKEQVTSATSGRQTPWIARNQMVGDFALF